MADVKIVDIDSEQWNMKDQNARDRLTILEEKQNATNGENINVSLASGVYASNIQFTNHVKLGKLHYALLDISNLNASFVGTTTSGNIGTTNIRPFTTFYAISVDYKTGVPIRIGINQDGKLTHGESYGMNKGNNQIRCPMWWIES